MHRVNDIMAKQLMRGSTWVDPEGWLAEFDLPGISEQQRATDAPRVTEDDALKRQLEMLQGCLFAYGLGEKLGLTFHFGHGEASNWDGAIHWNEGDVDLGCYAPVQLKELVPEELNARTSLQQEVNKLAKYDNSPDLYLVMHVNRTRADIDRIEVPDINVGGIFIIAAVSPDQRRWALIGDLRDSKDVTFFDYPRRTT